MLRQNKESNLLALIKKNEYQSIRSLINSNPELLVQSLHNEALPAKVAFDLLPTFPTRKHNDIARFLYVETMLYIEKENIDAKTWEAQLNPIRDAEQYTIENLYAALTDTNSNFQKIRKLVSHAPQLLLIPFAPSKEPGARTNLAYNFVKKDDIEVYEFILSTYKKIRDIAIKEDNLVTLAILKIYMDFPNDEICVEREGVSELVSFNILVNEVAKKYGFEDYQEFIVNRDLLKHLIDRYYIGGVKTLITSFPNILLLPCLDNKLPCEYVHEKHSHLTEKTRRKMDVIRYIINETFVHYDNSVTQDRSGKHSLSDDVLMAVKSKMKHCSIKISYSKFISALSPSENNLEKVRHYLLTTNCLLTEVDGKLPIDHPTTPEIYSFLIESIGTLLVEAVKNNNIDCVLTILILAQSEEIILAAHQTQKRKLRNNQFIHSLNQLVIDHASKEQPYLYMELREHLKKLLSPLYPDDEIQSSPEIDAFKLEVLKRLYALDCNRDTSDMDKKKSIVFFLLSEFESKLSNEFKTHAFPRQILSLLECASFVLSNPKTREQYKLERFIKKEPTDSNNKIELMLPEFSALSESALFIYDLTQQNTYTKPMALSYSLLSKQNPLLEKNNEVYFDTRPTI